ncbi:MAG: pantoate--beta-alanine ligase [Flavobacteriaceae bacterium]|nr:pantoate--beta-alanine ligase [Flavobacteriaceae bacterium]
MIISKTKAELKKHLSLLKDDKKTLGFVPTMGAFHEGHLSLVKKALADNDYIIVSIFVNPTQFDKEEDLVNYPKALDADVNLLKSVSDNISVYAPSVNDIYGDNTASEHFNFGGIEHEMEGKFRTGHFDGVGTILKKLFELIMPDHAYFGKKDFQQYRIVQKLVEILKLDIKIIGCEIYRETSGLAMSSRNERLSEEMRKEAAFIYKTLQEVRDLFKNKSANQVKKWVISAFENNEFLTLEYIEISDIENLKPVKRKSKNKTYRAFISVFADKIRLIDNIALNLHT